jgi:hypothetical protein
MEWRDFGYTHEKSSYALLMEELYQKHPDLKEYIGRVRIVTGTGWGISFCPSFGLTFRGIRQVLHQLGLKQAQVADSAKSFRVAVNSIQTRGCIVTEPAILQTGCCSGTLHAISVFVEKQENRILLSINDSYGETTLTQKMREDFFSNRKILEMTSRLQRQAKGEITCNAFAIQDCVAFENDPQIMDKLASLNGYENAESSEVSYPLKVLPQSMMSLSKVEAARAKALEYQCMVIDRFEKGMSLLVEPQANRIYSKGIGIILLLGLMFVLYKVVI